MNKADSPAPLGRLVILLNPEDFRSRARALVAAAGGQTAAMKILEGAPRDEQVSQPTLSRICGGRVMPAREPLRRARGRPPKPGKQRPPAPRSVFSRAIAALGYLAKHLPPGADGPRLAREFAIAAGGHYGLPLKLYYLRSLQAEVKAYVLQPGPRWVRGPMGARPLTRNFTPTAEDLRVDAYRELLERVGRECPDLVERLARAINESGYTEERAVVAWVRILGPFLRHRDSALIERDWRDFLTVDGKIAGSKLERMMRDGVRREMALLGGRLSTFEQRLAAAATPYNHSTASGLDREDDPKTFRLTEEARQWYKRIEELRPRWPRRVSIALPDLDTTKPVTPDSVAEHFREVRRRLREHRRELRLHADRDVGRGKRERSRQAAPPRSRATPGAIRGAAVGRDGLAKRGRRHTTAGADRV